MVTSASSCDQPFLSYSEILWENGARSSQNWRWPNFSDHVCRNTLGLDRTYAIRWAVANRYDQPDRTFMRSRAYLSDHGAICKAMYFNWKNFDIIHWQARSDSPCLIWPLMIATDSARYWSQSKLIALVRLILFGFMNYNWSLIAPDRHGSSDCVGAIQPIGEDLKNVTTSFLDPSDH